MNRTPYLFWLVAGTFFALASLLAGVVNAQSGHGAATARLALVIGNSKYDTLPVQPTSVNDARDVAAALERLGFDVTTEIESTLGTMRQAMERYLAQLGQPENRGALAVFYFAGHGLQFSGHNFMLPTDFDIDEGQDDLQRRALWLDGQITGPMASAHAGGANVVMLEACREYPFGDSPGLAQVDIVNNLPERALVMFAAAPGEPSADVVDLKAPERNGIFTKGLLKHLAKAGANSDLNGFFEVVQNEVIRVSNRAQKPRMVARLTGPPISLAKASTATSDPGDLALWKSVQDSPDLCDFEHYLARYPSGEFADRANAKIRSIGDAKSALARSLRLLPASVAATVKAEETLYLARCAKKYGKTSQADRLRIFALTSAARDRLSDPPALAPIAGPGAAGWPTFKEAMNPKGQLAPARLVRAVHTSEHKRAPTGSLRLVQAPSSDTESDTGSEPAADAPEVVGDEEFRATLLLAQQGNVDAMYRAALIYEKGSNSVPQDTDKMLRWLVVSSALGNGLASYKLYRHFNAERRTLADAIRYKSLARKQGYAGPPGLSLRR